MIRDRLKSPDLWIRLAGLVVVASVGLALAHLTWRLTGQDDGRTRLVAPTNAASAAAGSGALASILALAPFGRDGGTDGLPATSLGLVLKGVIYSPDPAASFALISTGGAPGQSWNVGQSPIAGAVIEAIEIDRVILNVAGRREVLAFPATAEIAVPPPGPATGTTPPQPLSGSVPQGTGPVPRAAPSASSGAPAPAGAAPPAPSSPASPGASPSASGIAATGQGYRIGPDLSEQMQRAGLQPGDLIRSLNGQPVGDVASDRQLLQRAAAAGTARVEVLRDGLTLNLTIPLR